MIEKYRSSLVPAPDPARDRDELEARVKGALSGLKAPYESAMDSLEFSDALARLWACIREMNGFVDKSAPWKEKDEETLSNVLYTLAEGLRLIAVYVYPFMPASAQKMWDAIGLDRRIEGSVLMKRRYGRIYCAILRLLRGLMAISAPRARGFKPCRFSRGGLIRWFEGIRHKLQYYDLLQLEVG